MIDEKKLIEILSKNSIFEKITNAEDKNIFDIINDLPKVDKWNLCCDMLPLQPEKNPLYGNRRIEPYLVCEENKNYTFVAFWDGQFFLKGYTICEVIAWKPLPEPYKESETL